MSKIVSEGRRTSLFVFSRDFLKLIAVAAMFCDHTAYLLIAPYSLTYMVMRFFGRMTAPIMCYFLSEGYRYTSSKKRYFLRLVLFGILAQPAYTLMAYPYHTPLSYHGNMLFTLALALATLSVLESCRGIVRAVLVIGLLCLSAFCDWMIFCPLWVIGFYRYRQDRFSRAVVFTGIAVCAAVIGGITFLPCQLGMAAAYLLIYLYERGRGDTAAKSVTVPRWRRKAVQLGFYLFYPLHLWVLVAVKWLGE